MDALVIYKLHHHARVLPLPRDLPLLARKKKGQETPTKKPTTFVGEKTFRKLTGFFFKEKKYVSKKKKAK